jgi:hypothetical protein
MQQEMGRRQGAAKAEISYPDVSFVCGAGLKQKMIGKASGDPRHQMKEAMDSINGLTASRQSAHWPKQPFSPHPWVQQSGHTVCTASALDHIWTISHDSGSLFQRHVDSGDRNRSSSFTYHRLMFNATNGLVVV